VEALGYRGQLARQSMCPLRWEYESLCRRFRATPVVSLLLRLAVEGHYNRCKNRQLTGVCFTLRARGFGCRPADLKGAKIWSVMRCACKCDAIRQVQALRRSCRRSPETENEALPNRRAHVGKVIDAGANDYITKLENAHGTEFGELLYPWHPWAGLRIGLFLGFDAKFTPLAQPA